MRNGLNGSASVAYPSMIVLLANLPNEVCIIQNTEYGVQSTELTPLFEHIA